MYCVRKTCQIGLNKKKVNDTRRYRILLGAIKEMVYFILSWNSYSLLFLMIDGTLKRSRRKKKVKLVKFVFCGTDYFPSLYFSSIMCISHFVWKLFCFNLLSIPFFMYYKSSFSRIKTWGMTSILSCILKLERLRKLLWIYYRCNHYKHTW